MISDAHLRLMDGMIRGNARTIASARSRALAGALSAERHRKRWTARRSGRLLAALVVAAFLLPSPADAQARTVLGEVDNGLFVGIGVPKPPRFESAIGFEVFSSLKWTRWGQPTARARGWFQDRSVRRRVRLVASSRGRHPECDDGMAYERLRISVSGWEQVTRVLCR